MLADTWRSLYQKGLYKHQQCAAGLLRAKENGEACMKSISYSPLNCAGMNTLMSTSL